MTGFIYAWLTKMFALLIDTGNMLETAELVLLGEPLDYDGTQIAGDIVVPTFTGYANEAIAAFTPAVDGDGVPYLAVPPTVFSPTNATNLPQFIYGAAILDADGDLVELCNFAEPLQLTLPGQQLHVTGRVKFSPSIDLEIEAYVE